MPMKMESEPEKLILLVPFGPSLNNVLTYSSGTLFCLSWIRSCLGNYQERDEAWSYDLGKTKCRNHYTLKVTNTSKAFTESLSQSKFENFFSGCPKLTIRHNRTGEKPHQTYHELLNNIRRKVRLESTQSPYISASYALVSWPYLAPW